MQPSLSHLNAYNRGMLVFERKVHTKFKSNWFIPLNKMRIMVYLTQNAWKYNNNITSVSIYPIFGRGEKYRCVKRAGSTRQWCDRSCSAVTKRGRCEWPTKGWWRSLTMTASGAIYAWGTEITYLQQNCSVTPTSLVYRHKTSKERFVSLPTLRYVLRVIWSGTSFCPHCLACGQNDREVSWRRRSKHSRGLSRGLRMIKRGPSETWSTPFIKESHLKRRKRWICFAEHLYGKKC